MSKYEGRSTSGAADNGGEGAHLNLNPMLQLLARIGYAHHQLDVAEKLDRCLEDDEKIGRLSKKFVIDFAPTNWFPFPHKRVRLKPKNMMPDIPVAVAGIRYPQDEEGVAYVSWQLQDGTEEYFVLSPSGFSRLDIAEAFRSDGSLAIEAVTHASETDLFNLDVVLKNFEPDLQNNRTNMER